MGTNVNGLMVKLRWLNVLVIFNAALGGAVAVAQEYPARPVRMIVANAPGGPTDAAARVIAQGLGDELKQAFVVENRAGAGGIIGTQAAAGAAPDGYTVLLSASGPLVVTPYLRKTLGYDPVASFAPIGFAAHSPLFLVVPASSKITTVGQLMSEARANPGKLNYGTAGIGTPPFMSAELFKRATGLNIKHVSYSGGQSQIHVALMTGELDMLFDSPSGLPLVKGGKLRALAVTSPERSELSPETPTMIEAGIADFQVNAWYALLVPAATPPSVRNKLSEALSRVLKSAVVRERYKTLGFEVPKESGGVEVVKVIQTEGARWKGLIESLGLPKE